VQERFLLFKEFLTPRSVSKTVNDNRDFYGKKCTVRDWAPLSVRFQNFAGQNTSPLSTNKVRTPIDRKYLYSQVNSAVFSNRLLKSASKEYISIMYTTTCRSEKTH
jgi:hypothetical protein